MIRANLTRLALGAALVISVPVAAAAQDDAATPEGVEWHLAGYAVDGEIGIVPWHIDATLLLEDGAASGSTGCNQFTGSYTLDGEALTFDPAVAMTRVACPADQSAVEDGYMANLVSTATWAIEDGDLMLADADGDHILGFERSVIALTTSDVAALVATLAGQQAEIDQLSGRVDNVRIGTLRDRIKTLEAQVKKLQGQQSSTSNSSRTSFTAAEQTLLKGIPTRIRGTCSALRGSGLPRGTVAAVQCRPGTDVVGEMAYYLMEHRDAVRTFTSVMGAHGVPERFRCSAGRPSQFLLHPNSAEGCFVDGGRANVRLMYMAAGCQQLDAGSTHLTSPVIYVAIEGKNRRISPLYAWTRDRHEGSAVTRVIGAPGQPLTPVCESDF